MLRVFSQLLIALQGANRPSIHLKNFNVKRDFLERHTDAERERVLIGDIAAARKGDPCSNCAGKLTKTRGIEIGNIFHLGVKYSSLMNSTILDQQGKSKPLIMDCYGIGITRILPAVIEERHDENGIIFPISIAPYHVHLCAISKKKPQVHESSERIYAEFQAAGVKVLFDDLDKGGSSQFFEADLIGLPMRLVVSPKTVANGVVEFKYRDNRSESEFVKTDDLVDFIKAKIFALSSPHLMASASPVAELICRN